MRGERERLIGGRVLAFPPGQRQKSTGRQAVAEGIDARVEMPGFHWLPGASIPRGTTRHEMVMYRDLLGAPARRNSEDQSRGNGTCAGISQLFRLSCCFDAVDARVGPAQKRISVHQQPIVHSDPRDILPRYCDQIERVLPEKDESYGMRQRLRDVAS